MTEAGRPCLFVLHHVYEQPADSALATLYFYREYDPNGPLVDEDPAALKLVGPTSLGECMTVIKSIKLVLEQLGIDCAQEHGCDD